MFAGLVPTVVDGHAVRYAAIWVPSLDLRLSFLVDGLSLLFGLLISGIGILVTLYAATYLRGHPRFGRFFFLLLLFMLAMLGLVLADDLITLFVFWELTTVTSFLLIGFDHDNEKARRNALQALLVTGAGGLALLAGILLLAAAGDSLELSALAAQGDAVRAHDHYRAILVLVLIGAFTKSAQVPFHFWLPNAMAAPTPVSAYLHSATMVKAGVYLLARLHPTLSGTPEWQLSLTLVGAATAVWASLAAVRQTDLKLALAHTTVMALGVLVMFLGSADPVAIAAAVTFLVAHALYKCGLFLVIGNLDHATGTRHVDDLGGLARAMPITATAAAVSALSMAGFPPFLGFIGKELKYEGALAVASEPALVAAAVVAANALVIVVAGAIGYRAFFGVARTTPRSPHEAPITMLIGPVVLGALGLTFGLLPPVIGEAIVEPAVAAIIGAPASVKLALWHGVNLPLVLSVVTVAAGLLMVATDRKVRRWLNAALARVPLSADRAYDAVLAATLALASWQTAQLQNGLLRRYLFVVFAALALGVGGTLLLEEEWAHPVDFAAPTFFEWGVMALITAGTAMAVVSTSRLAALCGLGTVGAGVALIFLMFGAPDVAMTQLLVEILFVVIISIVLLRLPPILGEAHRSVRTRLRDGVLATLSGVVMAALVMAATVEPVPQRLTRYFEATSVPEAYGRNIVNVILVDFRALDTLGEITVVAVAALAAFALIRLRHVRRSSP
jgi:multicomponent Na+:H+ antiporter subunit A